MKKKSKTANRYDVDFHSFPLKERPSLNQRLWEGGKRTSVHQTMNGQVIEVDPTYFRSYLRRIMEPL